MGKVPVRHHLTAIIASRVRQREGWPSLRCQEKINLVKRSSTQDSTIDGEC